MKGIRCLLALGTASVVLLAAPGIAAAATVANGDFETGTLSGWQTQNSGTGDWFAYSGTTSPMNGFTIDAPPQGSFAAVTDQSNPGTNILYQDVALEPGNAHTLRLYVYYTTEAAIASPDTLDSGGEANQQYRVDVIRPSAALDSLDPADVLLTVFRTVTGDPTTLAPTIKTADLSPFAGQTVRLRFAEVDNQFYFQASADAVSIASTAIPTTAASKDPKCKKLRKKLKRQQKGLAKASTEAKQAMIQANIEDTKKRLQKRGC
jgi:hypothetical protein